MRTPPRHFPPARRAHAFSLVEVTLALGIVTFGLVSMLGMLPVALDTFRQSTETTAASRIAQQLVAKAQETDFTQLSVVEGTYRYDNEGAKASGTANAIYAALVSVTTVALPGSTTPDPRLKLVKIDITKHDQPISKSTVTYVAKADSN